MGCSFSSRIRSSCRVNKNVIRVVHLSGYVEDFEYPVSVSQVTGGSGSGRPPKQFLCTPAQLFSNCCKGLQADTILEAGHIYLLLPYSTLQTEASPVDLASIAKKLTAKATSTKCKPKSTTSPSPAFTSPNRSVRNSDTLRSTRLRPWRPILDTIREKSFNRRSESDLQEA